MNLQRPLKDNSKGVVGIYTNTDKLKESAKNVRNANIKDFDAFTPFPVHGIDEAMGLKRSWIPYITFLAGMAGVSFGLFFQIWTSAYDWPLNVGGKPLVSLPAFIPVAFECTILLAGLSTAAALFFACRIPKPNALVLDPEITNDKFALFVSAGDPNYNETQMSDLMRNGGADEVRVL